MHTGPALTQWVRNTAKCVDEMLMRCGLRRSTLSFFYSTTNTHRASTLVPVAVLGSMDTIMKMTHRY